VFKVTQVLMSAGVTACFWKNKKTTQGGRSASSLRHRVTERYKLCTERATCSRHQQLNKSWECPHSGESADLLRPACLVICTWALHQMTSIAGNPGTGYKSASAITALDPAKHA